MNEQGRITDDWTPYFSGKKLYGDDFSLEEIMEWYKDEEEAYADLSGKTLPSDKSRHKFTLDVLFGYKYLPDKKFKNALGFGSAWGYEFLPIIEDIEKLTIIDPSEQMKSEKIGAVSPVYVKSDVSGKIDFADNTFDLITCFGVLHHIPNVSFVLSELIRVLDKDGYLLLREPINSMGDWRNPRKGLTKRERGIPLSLFKNIFASGNCKTVKVSYHYFIYGFLGTLFGNPSFLRNKSYLRIDSILSRLFVGNVHYHPRNKFQRIAPVNAYYVIKKL